MNMHELKTRPWQIRAEDFERQADTAHRMQFLLRYAILAPSTRNTQPWRFHIDGNRIRVYGDELLWQRVADPRARELHISLGCAIENLLVASEHFGYRHHLEFFPGSPGDVACQVTLEPDGFSLARREAALFGAITRRHTNHHPYDGRAVPKEYVEALEACVREEGFSLLLTADPDVKRTVDGLVVQADAIQFSMPDYREELGELIGRGVFGAPWLFSHIGALAVSYLNLGKSFAKKDHEVLMSAPVLGILGALGDDRETHLKTGRIFERILLTATSFGLAVQPMSQVVEVPDLRAELAKSVPLRPGYLPQQPFRMGYGEPEKEHTPRRPLEEVLM